jgi:hypothetical protein
MPAVNATNMSNVFVEHRTAKGTEGRRNYKNRNGMSLVTTSALSQPTKRMFFTALQLPPKIIEHQEKA